MTNTLVFPADLPQPVLGSDNIEYDFGIETTSMASGFIRQRRRYENMPATMSLTFRMDRVGGARLLTFLNEAAGGSFDLKAQVPQSIDQSHATVSVRQAGALKSSVLSNGIRLYSFDVYIEQVTPYPQGFFAGFDAFGNDLALAVNLLSEIANEILPNAATGLEG